MLIILLGRHRQSCRDQSSTQTQSFACTDLEPVIGYYFMKWPKSLLWLLLPSVQFHTCRKKKRSTRSLIGAVSPLPRGSTSLRYGSLKYQIWVVWGEKCDALYGWYGVYCNVDDRIGAAISTGPFQCIGFATIQSGKYLVWLEVYLLPSLFPDSDQPTLF